MTYVCLKYMDEKRWDGMSQMERDAFMDDCLAYDESLRTGGHMLRKEVLQSVRNAATLRLQNGQISVTDGPATETREQLGGFLVFEAKDLNHALQLMSKHPAIRRGASFEVRPTEQRMPGNLVDR
jgi:hypothetical protein